MKFLQRWFQPEPAAVVALPTATLQMESTVPVSPKKLHFKQRARKQLEDLLINKPEKAVKRRSLMMRSKMDYTSHQHQYQHHYEEEPAGAAMVVDAFPLATLSTNMSMSTSKVPLLTKPERVLVRGKFSSKGELRDWDQQPELFDEETSVHSLHLSSEASSPTLAYDSEFSEVSHDDDNDDEYAESFNSSQLTFRDMYSIKSTDGIIDFAKEESSEHLMDDHAESCEYCKQLILEKTNTTDISNTVPRSIRINSKIDVALYITALVLNHRKRSRKVMPAPEKQSIGLNEYIKLAFF